MAMRQKSKRLLAVSCFCLTAFGTSSAAFSQAKPSISIALKSGETIELGTLYYVVNCRSILTSTPQVEVLDGPEEITVTVKPQMVLPRTPQCAKQVSGGMLTVTAKKIEEAVTTPLVIRLKYPTKDGDRLYSRTYDVSLFP
jgi:hypothetical protein